MRYAWRAFLAGGLGFAVSFLVACGGGAGLLSGGQSSNLNDQLNQIASAVDSGNCGAAASASAGLGSEVAGLPPTINPTLRRNLAQGASTVSQLAAKQCHQTTTTTSSSTTPTTTTTSSTTSTPTTTTTSTPTTTTSTATTTSSSGTTSTGGSGGAGLGAGTGGAGAGGAAADTTASRNGP